ncbi:HAD-IIIC family phosphatase [uncultured Erythrobacter sp.]|uniref:HAD-IIIC family phosphatase n=1 Tax=uncultured Erythrobacter sp. TaxID=263913 RepID=UPI00261C5720|nr:HAD-IIIC family phosphatase [uncultured Erythrobacter sp.]
MSQSPAGPFALSWLLEPPEDFRAQLKALRSDPQSDVAQLRALGRFDLDLNQLGQLGKAAGKRREDLAASGLRSLRLAIAGTHTVDFLVDALAGTGLRHGLLIDTFVTDYGQTAQAVLDPTSALFEFKPDLVYLAFDPSALGIAQPRLDAQGGEKAVQSALDYALSLRDAAHANAGVGVILQSLPVPASPLFGGFDACQPGSVRWMVQQFNARLAEALAPGDLFFDLAALAETIGLSDWHDPARWHDAKVPFALDAIPLAADHLCRLLAAVRGLSRKCLVLDLDNTLWGGVIGDDGVEGIALGQGTGTGEAYVAIQQYAKHLRTRGIILAVCSKNEDANARLPFQHHEEMVLGEDDIAVFIANWTDKASNLQHIAKVLNIGTDALVFLDDNPAERERVRQELPEVAVPEVGADPAQYVPLLSAAGYFEAVSFGDEDRKRAEMYQANAARASEMQKIGNMDDYLRSLDMVCSLRPFDALGRARTAQLINKSNQFNLTTRRYTEAEVAAFETDADTFTLQVRLTDRFGDNGMISVIIFKKQNAVWICDSWLMSCRVLGRRVEEAVLATVVKAARADGASKLVGDWLPTPKNGLVEKHFEKLGFDFVSDLPDGGTRWALDLDSYAAVDLPMEIEQADDLIGAAE